MITCIIEDEITIQDRFMLELIEEKIEVNDREFSIVMKKFLEERNCSDLGSIIGDRDIA